MPEFLPGKFLDPQRDVLAADWRRDVSIRNPGADVGQGSEPWLSSLVATDAILPLYTYAHDVAGGTSWETASGGRLDQWIVDITGQPRLAAVGAVGAVQIDTSVGGAVLQAGDTGTCNGFSYQVVVGGQYFSGAQVVVIGVDTGPQTDQPAGSGFIWQTPRPGLNNAAVVTLQPDGTGLSGGALAETDDQAKLRLRNYKNNPPSSGNDADYQRIIGQTSGVAVQQGYTFPAIQGPGSIGFTATLRPASPGGSRIPSTPQLQMIYARLQAYFPASDGIYIVSLAQSLLSVVLKTLWAPGAAGWIDASPFPLYQSPGNNWLVTSVVVPTPTTFHIKSLTDATVPQPGQNIGLFDLVGQAFRRKRILSATAASGGYTIVVDTTGGASNLTFTPAVGAMVSPWSDSLNAVIDPVLAYFDAVGPGEMYASFFDAGLRQKRSPASPTQWSSVVNNRLLGGPTNASQPFSPSATAAPSLFATAALADVELVEPSPPYQTPTGTPAVSVFLLSVGALAVFPET